MIFHDQKSTCMLFSKKQHNLYNRREYLIEEPIYLTISIKGLLSTIKVGPRGSVLYHKVMSPTNFIIRVFFSFSFEPKMPRWGLSGGPPHLKT